jgi:hypothetical protein
MNWEIWKEYLDENGKKVSCLAGRYSNYSDALEFMEFACRGMGMWAKFYIQKKEEK